MFLSVGLCVLVFVASTTLPKTDANDSGNDKGYYCFGKLSAKPDDITYFLNKNLLFLKNNKWYTQTRHTQLSFTTSKENFLRSIACVPIEY